MLGSEMLTYFSSPYNTDCSLSAQYLLIPWFHPMPSFPALVLHYCTRHALQKQQLGFNVVSP